MELIRDGGIVSVPHYSSGEFFPIRLVFHLGSMDSNTKTDRPFFLTHSGRWRFIQVLMISIFGQWSGNGLGYFNTSLYSIMGYTSSGTQLLLNLVTQIVQAAGALAAVTLSDKMPRRKVLVPGTFGKLYPITPFPLPSLQISLTVSETLLVE